MSNKYDFASVEPKWQKYWEEHGSFRAKEDHTKPKFYALVEFPYPSGHGMHVGHIKAYSGLEVVSRKRQVNTMTALLPGLLSFARPMCYGAEYHAQHMEFICKK